MAIDFPDSPTQGQTFQSGDRLWIYNGYAWDYLLNVVTSELSDHGLLIGLTDDDHSQYLLADGSRTLSGNLTVTGTVDGRDVAADGTKLDGIESGATADQTASEILTAIKTVDGPDSGLDADTLDGNQAADFEPVGTTATHAADNDIHVVAGTATGQVATWNNSTGAWEAQAASGGVTDHGALTGLTDDDHTQYPRFTASDVAPSSPRANDIWYHTNKGRIFVYYDSFWVENASAVIAGTELAALASGGTITDDGTYVYHTFTASGTFSLLSPGVLDVECIVVAGGGGGGSNNGGGGGAGGAIISSLSIQNTQNAIVGLGGAIDNNGSPSSFAGISVTGGGYGGSFSNKPGSDGGSGGGAGSSSSGVSPGGSGVLGQGYDGGSNYPASSAGRSSGGGGGAGGLGEDGTNAKGGNGGPGVEWPSGSGVYYAAGGGGWVYSSDPSNVGLGGSSIGGNGGTYPSGVAATNPIANTGSGGGGGISSLPASAGADGVVIIRYNPSTDWVPSSILSLSPTLWLDASDASTIIEFGGAVSQWSDKSGNDNHVTQNNASDRPTTGTNEINNLNVLQFYGSQILYRNETAINNSVNRSWTIFGVVKPSATSSIRIAFGSDSGSRIGQFLRINNAVYETIGFSGGSAFTDSAGSAIIDEAVVLTSVNDSGNSLELFVNGASQASVNMGTQNYTNTIPLVVGDRNLTNGNGWSGSIAEIIAFDRKLTQQERENIENILAQKWGIDFYNVLGLSPTLWLDASDASTIIESGGAVSQWSDKSGNDNHAVQATSSRQPTTGVRTLNGRNTIDFDGIADVLTGGSEITANTTNVTMIAVFDPDSIQNLCSPFHNGLSSNGYGIAHAANISTLGYLAGGISWEDSDLSATTNPQIVVFQISSGNPLLRYNGSAVTGVPPSSFNTPTGLYSIGSHIGTSNFFDGTIAELIFFDRTLTADEVLETEIYLSVKWGITL